MNETKNKISDGDIDRLLQVVWRESLPGADMIDEIADSPRLQWSLQSRIANEKSQRRRNNFFVWQLATASACLLILLGLSFSYWFAAVNKREETAVAGINEAATAKSAPLIENNSPPANNIAVENSPVLGEIKETRVVVSKISRQFSAAKPLKVAAQKLPLAGVPKKQLTRQLSAPKAVSAQDFARLDTTEIKTDFIPLTYSPASESGQIVRVKVPRALMISLGASTRTDNTAELVKADVLLDDDGLARAIRFIR